MAYTSDATRLPFEIWRECFMLLNAADHKALANACHFFRDICLAFIFKSMSYSFKLWYHKRSEVQDMVNQIKNLDRHLARFGELSKSHRSPLVRKYTLRYSLHLARHTEEAIIETAKEAYDEFVEGFVKYIPAFVNLREVQIYFPGKNMDKKILAALAMLPDLDELSFHAVRFGVHLLKSRIKVRKLVIDNTKAADTNPNPGSKRLDMFSGECLESLTVLSWSYAPKIFRALTKQGISKSLSHLSFQLLPKDMQDLYPFLASCPNLESLHVDFGSREDLKTLSLAPLPRSTVPRLKSFYGHGIAATTFIPGRPVKKVRIEDQRYTDRRDPTEMNGIFPEITQSAGPIVDLDIQGVEYGTDILTLVTTHFPKLTRLRLNLPLPHKGAFIGEDPHALKLDKVVDENIKRQANDAQNDQPMTRMLPVAYHYPYMHILHWVALRRIDLPPVVETLYFHTHIPNYREPFFDDEDKFSRLNPNIKAYTLSMAHSIFDTLSVQYSALRNVVVGDINGITKKFSWSKLASEKWVYSEYY